MCVISISDVMQCDVVWCDVMYLWNNGIVGKDIPHR